MLLLFVIKIHSLLRHLWFCPQEKQEEIIWGIFVQKGGQTGKTKLANPSKNSCIENKPPIEIMNQVRNIRAVT